MHALRLKAHIGSDSKLEWVNPPEELPAGDVDVILVYSHNDGADRRTVPCSEWPVLDGGQYLAGSLRREELYSDDGR